MVALKEVSDFALAQFGLSELSRGSGTAQNEVSTLFGAIRGTLV
jgi:hypothetical protein